MGGSYGVEPYSLHRLGELVKLFVKLSVRSGLQRTLAASLLGLTACSSGVLTELPLEPTAHETYLKVAVRAPDDDAEELRSGVIVGKGAYDLDFSQDGRKVGLRFTDLAIPKGALVTRAYLGFKVASSDSGAPFSQSGLKILILRAPLLV